MNTREQKQFYAITEQHGVKYVTGYACPTPNQWWVPELGFSMTVGFHLFDSKELAKEKARQEIQNEIFILKSQLEALNS